MKTLIAQAKRLDNGEWVEGTAHKEEFYEYQNSLYGVGLKYFIIEDINTEFEVDPSTLQYKVGEHYLTVEEIETKCKPKSCESCKYFDHYCSNSYMQKSDSDYWFTPSKDFYCSKFEPKDKA